MVRVLTPRWADQFASQRKSLERPVPPASDAIAMLGNSESHVVNAHLVTSRFDNLVKSSPYRLNEEKMNHGI